MEAAGVAPWDAIIREGKSKVSPPPPLTLGSDLAGKAERVGARVTEFHKGDVVPVFVVSAPVAEPQQEVMGATLRACTSRRSR